MVTTAQIAVGTLCRLCFLVPQVLPIAFRDSSYQDFGDYYPQPLLTPPKVEPCNGFPGTYQWNQCWNNYKNQAAQYPAQSPANYGNGNGHIDSLSESHGSSTFLNSNGYNIRASGLSLNANNFNGQLYIEASTGLPDRIDPTKHDNTLRINLVYNGGRLIKWVTVTPPRGVRVDNLRYEQRDQMLRIWADEGRNKGFLGFGNSGVVSTVSLSFVIAVASLQVIATTSFFG